MISFVTRRVTDDLFVPNYRIIEFFFTRRIADSHGGFICHEFANLRIVLHTENCGWSRRIYLSRISELFFTRRIADGHGGFICHELANYSSHGESRTVTEDFFVTNLRIVLHTENCGWSRRIYLSRISELANYSSHGESRTVTEDFYGMRPLLWTY